MSLLITSLAAMVLTIIGVICSGAAGQSCADIKSIRILIAAAMVSHTLALSLMFWGAR